MSNIVVLFALVCALSAQHLLVAGFMRGGLESPTGSFVRVTETGDGQRETVVSWGGFLAVEYVVEARHIHGQVSAREMTNGHDMLRLFFKGRGNLLDCELFEGDAIQVAEFFRSYSNRTRKVEDGSGLSEVLDRHPEIDRTLVDWETSKESCVRLQHEAQKLVEDDEVERKTGHENEVKVPSRSRRGISLMWPGTTWCGVGNRSRDNAETEGVHVDTDKCCRQHDLCNYTIEAFTTKYNMLNFRFHTISHCECDDRFRTCLRMAGSPHSDTVGRLFFNILGMKCFIFEKEIVCKERNWWGKCIRQGYEYTAKLRESVPYYNE